MDHHRTIDMAAAHVTTGMSDLAHVPGALDDPAALHPLIGELRSTVRSLVQVADQLAHAHMRHRSRARTDDDADLGAREADSATWALVRARELLDAAGSATDLASESSGRVAWASVAANQRWLSVIFLQGTDADQALNTIDRSGAQSVIRQLAHWDLGDETTDAALVNGYVYEGIPRCPTDRTAEDPTSEYTLVYNTDLRYVSLLRRFARGSNDEDPAPQAVESHARRSRTPTFPAWTSSRRNRDAAAVRSVAL